MTTFEKLLLPLKDFLELEGKEIDTKTGSRKLFFANFTLTFLYSVLMNYGSLRSIISNLKTDKTAKKLGFCAIAYSTFRDAFSRFESNSYKKTFLFVYQGFSWKSLDNLNEIGLFSLIDGSILPTIQSMTWAKYKTTKNAIRLHLELCLNKMIVTEFICQKANSAERAFLIKICKKSITYIADRGYFSFDLANFILKKEAFIIFRIKKNMLIKREQKLEITSLKQKIPIFFDNLIDQIIYFTNDPHENKYRLISFNITRTKFVICTNRFDLSTLEIIMLYAYRWQIELFFKFLKRTMNGIHLFNHSENGVNIQFYCFMIIILLQLKLKQSCQNNAQNCLKLKKQMYQKNEELLKNANQMSPEKWIEDINQVFHISWKIGKHWLEQLRNLIIEPFNQETVEILAQNH